MKHIIIGTAGHIDHGKTALVRALTGIDTDRLKEEQRRGITIDLGFAYLHWDDLQIGFIDVPGHERFIHNMLAGIGGIDFVLLVVAADESVMPQTREHFDICCLLGIRQGAVVVTKVDLVDPEMLELVASDIIELTAGSFLEKAPIFYVSAKSGAGIEELKHQLHQIALKIADRSASQALRLPIDRVFSVKGFGTVVTGTLLAGSLHKDQDLEFLPGALPIRVRNLQSYGQSVNLAQAGQRVAVNVQGVEVGQLRRGMVLAERGVFAASSLLDVRIEMLPSSPTSMKHLSRIHLHIGSHQLVARAGLWETLALEPGRTGFAQLRLESPTVCAHGDRFILRRFSPLVTVGGGIILHSHPPKLRRRSTPRLASIPEFETASETTKLSLDIEWAGIEGRNLFQLSAIFGYSLAAIRRHLDTLEKNRKVTVISRNPLRAISRRHIESIKQKLLVALREFHNANPLARGAAREELRQRILEKQDADLFACIIGELSDEQKISLQGDVLALFGKQVTLSEDEQRIKDQIENHFKSARMNPPGIEETLAKFETRSELARKIFHMLVREGRLAKIGEDMTFHSTIMEELIIRLKAAFPPGKPFSVPEFKDLFGLTRKFAIPILEYLDRQRITRRSGDFRQLV